jgi:integrase
MEAEKALEEINCGPAMKHHGWDWPIEFLRVRYHSNPATLERYLDAWQMIAMFIDERDIIDPIGWLRSHCFDYVTWRQKPNKSKGKYRAGLNTALLELKILRIVLQEAVERGMIQANPTLRLGIEKAPRKLKPELTDEDCDFIRSEIAKVTDLVVHTMLTNSFEIARYQGCRLSETCLNPMDAVDLDARTIRFHAKGGKEFVTALHPKLVPLFQELQKQGRVSTWDAPEGSRRQWASAKWTKFMDSHGIKAKLGDTVCFHSTRVTVVTRLARNDVPLSKAKTYVGHASTLIHETYQRLRADDLAGCTDAVG